jgi:hypothetical protein
LGPSGASPKDLRVSSEAAPASRALAVAAAGLVARAGAGPATAVIARARESAARRSCFKNRLPASSSTGDPMIACFGQTRL